MQRLLQLATSGDSAGASEDLRHKPNHDALDGDDDDAPAASGGVYKPPKMSATPYDDGGQTRREWQKERQLRRAASSSTALTANPPGFADLTNPASAAATKRTEACSGSRRCRRAVVGQRLHSGVDLRTVENGAIEIGVWRGS